MHYQFVICEDQAAERAHLSALVCAWAEQSGHTVGLISFENAEKFLLEYTGNPPMDILLLDIEMGRTDGVTLARQIRSENELTQIIFVTGYSDYIADGYDVGALHYLMKPVNRDKFFSILDRAAQKIQKNGQSLLLELPDETVRIPLYEIRYLDVRQNYVTVHGKRDYTVKKPLRELELMLDSRFFRIGRSCIVNLLFIRRATRTEVFLTDESVLPLPRGMYEPLNRAIIDRI